MASKRLLIAYAHPDDESFGNGGLISKYVDEGVEVYLICATDGDMGTIPDEMQDAYDTVRELRLAELDCAVEKLGFADVFTFGYKDSGMMGADSTNDPDCLWYNWQHNSDDVTRRVVEVMREVQPHVVITFNQYGGYGHPDHIAIQRATEEAFALAGDESYLTEGQQPYQPQKLYYSSIPALLLRFFLFWMQTLYKLGLSENNPREMGKNNDIDFVAVVDHIEPVHANVDIANYLEAWDEASRCHASQGGGSMTMRFPMWLRRWLMGKQGFTRVVPAPRADKVDEADLFEHVTVEESALVS